MSGAVGQFRGVSLALDTVHTVRRGSHCSARVSDPAETAALLGAGL